MNIFRRLIRLGVAGLFAVVSTFFAPVAFSSDIMRVEGAPVVSTKVEEAVVWRFVSSISNATAVTFMPLPASALKTLQEENSQESANGLNAKPLKIGVNRNALTEISDATPFALNWQNIGDGHIARLAITSPEAKALRVALRLRVLPESAELRFSGSGAPEKIIGVTGGEEANALRDDNNVYWTPVTEGETQNIEIYLPSTIKLEDVKIRLNAVSHLFTSAREGFSSSGLVLAASFYCEVDVACKFDSLGTAFQNISKAVARMATTDGLYSYSCSGTLLNSADNAQTPYFWSAAHCMESSTGRNAQNMANTLNTFWFDEAAACRSSQINPNYVQRTGGAQILHHQASTDTLLLRLNSAPPSDAWFAAWDASRFSSGAFTAIHHPSRDIKKVSLGKGEGRTCDSLGWPSDGASDLSKLSLVSFSEGIIEQGSSGSGLFTLSNGAYYLRGGAMGAAYSMMASPSGCSLVNQPPEAGNAACYSSLSLVYDSIKQYLGNSSVEPPPPGPTRNYTGQWHRPDESSWGLTVLQGFSGQPRYIFIPWYTYDDNGKASWYIFFGDVWSANDKITAPVRRYVGPAWRSHSNYDNSRVSYTEVGTATLTFTSATAAKFEYSVEGASRTVNLLKIE